MSIYTDSIDDSDGLKTKNENKIKEKRQLKSIETGWLPDNQQNIGVPY